MTTASVSPPGPFRRIDRLALRAGMALVRWAGRHAERGVLTPERRAHRIAVERLQLERETAAQRALPLR